MKEERGCLGRWFRIGCGFTLALALVLGTVALYSLRTTSSTPEPTAEKRESVTSKRDAVERSLQTKDPLDIQFDETELTLLARQYLDEKGVAGDVRVTLPEEDTIQLFFRMPAEQLKRFVKADRLPSLRGSDVWGELRAHLSIVNNEPFAALESASLYGVPLPLTLLGSASHENWLLERLDTETASAVRRIRKLEIRDATLFLTLA